MELKTKLEDMSVGDIIPCRYKATTVGVAGTFSELGTCTATEIPVTGTPTPDGLFYFRKSDKGMLIADRVVQTNISWGALNNAKQIQGLPLTLTSIITSDAGAHPSCPALNAFDSNPSTKWLNNTSSGNHWIKIYTGNTPIDLTGIITPVLLRTSQYSIKNWKVYGSKDDVTYTELASGLHPNDGTPTNFTLSSSDYTYFRLNIIDSYGDPGEVAVATFYLSGFENIKMANTYLIRSLTGGNSYLGTDGKASLTDKGLGAFPANNEWDKYIVKSDLNGTITAGDNNVWHWHEGVYSYHCDTPVIGLDASTSRVARGAFKYKGSWISEDIKHFSYGLSSGTGSHIGFRPVLEYLEPNSKATTLFY